MARLYVLWCCSTPKQKNKLLSFQIYIKKIKNVKISNPFCSIVDKKTKKTDYAIHSNNVATLLAVLLLSQLSLQIKNKHKKLSNLGNFELVLSKASCAGFLVAPTFFDRKVISFLCNAIKN